jgi:hypothetical protein
MRALVAANPIGKRTFETALGYIVQFWRFLDQIEDVSAAGGGTFCGPKSVFDIPGLVWSMFKDWLAGGATTAHYSYFWCKRIFDLAATLLQTGDLTKHGFPLPPNPFPNPHKMAARRPGNTVVQTADTLDVQTARAAAKALFSHFQETDTRIRAQRDALANLNDDRGQALREWLGLAHENGWIFAAVSEERTRAVLDRVGDPEIVKVKHGLSKAARPGLWILPSANEILVAMALVMLRTGWNTSTIIDMNVEKWWEPHPTKGNQIARLSSRKLRAKGKVQQSWSDRHNPQHPFQVVLRVVEWTRILRDGLKMELDRIKLRLAAGGSEAEQEALKRQIQKIDTMSRRIWLSFPTTTTVGRKRRISLELRPKYEYVNKVLADAGVTLNGRPLSFTQMLTRDSWALFAYEASGYNLLVTQLALGHGDLASILHYLDRKALRNRHRRQFFDLQTHVLHELEKGRLVPRVLRRLVDKGEISEEEAAILQRGGVISRQGIACANPRNPDREIDPRHAVGEVCRAQACLDGCSKAFVTFDGGLHIARRIIELRRLRDEMPLLAWTSSDHPHDLDFFEQVMARFSPLNRSAAFDKAAAEPRPLIYTVPGRSALTKTAKG